jgi:large subunit ribosomal protein L25
MSETIILEAESREKTGKAESRRMRRAGKIPAIIYGGDKPDLAIALDFISTGKLLNDEHFHTSMVEIKVAGVRGKNTAILKDVQYDPLRDEPTHLDFQRVSGKDTVHINVPVVAINFEKCPGDVAGGLLEVVRHELEVICRADSIPEHIEVDCAKLDIGDTVHIEDVALPKGVEVQHDVNFTVLNVAAPKLKGEASDEEAAGDEEATEE